jgi:hypothetical protein
MKSRRKNQSLSSIKAGKGKARMDADEVNGLADLLYP